MKKNIILITSIIVTFLILVGSIAYYRIIVKGKIKASTGNAVFVLKDENSNVWNNKEIDLGKINPGDSGSFTITMDASSSNVDMYATLELDREALPTNLKFYTTSDHKSELHKYYSFLEKDGTNKETLTIYWYWNPRIDDEEDSKFINKENMEANIKVSAVQISEYAMMKNGYSNKTEFWSDTYRPYIRMIVFGNDLSNLPSECNNENLCFDISYDSNQNNKVYAYLINSGLKVNETDSTTNTIATKPLYNLYIVSDVMIFAPTNCYCMFRYFENLIQIDFNNNFNTSNVTNMNAIFYECESLITLNISNFNTSNVINMAYMFAFCYALQNIDLSSFNTSNVTIMGGMFYWCKSLKELDLSSFNTTNVTDMGSMFLWCNSLKTLDLSGFNTSNVTSMWGMFHCCESLTSLDLSNFDTSKVTLMYRMFYCCFELEKLDLSSFNTTNVTDMYGMFNYCKKLQTEITIMNPNVTDYTDMFLIAATDSNAHIIIGYITGTETVASAMRDTCTNETSKTRIELKKID